MRIVFFFTKVQYEPAYFCHINKLITLTTFWSYFLLQLFLFLNSFFMCAYLCQQHINKVTLVLCCKNVILYSVMHCMFYFLESNLEAIFLIMQSLLTAVLYLVNITEVNCKFFSIYKIIKCCHGGDLCFFSRTLQRLVLRAVRLFTPHLLLEIIAPALQGWLG